MPFEHHYYPRSTSPPSTFCHPPNSNLLRLWKRKAVKPSLPMRRKPPITNTSSNKSYLHPKEWSRLRNDEQALLEHGLEKTKNNTGFTYHTIGIPEEHWLSSLPHSDKPLLDVGACYGVQTIHALKNRRNVLSLDSCEQHITILRNRVAELDDHLGTLAGTIVAELPLSHAVDDMSVAGILCSEVIHFLNPAKTRQLFKDFFKWLLPGGLLVVSSASWPSRAHALQDRGYQYMLGKCTVDHALHLLKTVPPDELVDMAPGMGMMLLPGKRERKKVYLLSVEELGELAVSAGFHVEELKYHNARKYGHSVEEQETVLLVAKKLESG